MVDRLDGFEAAIASGTELPARAADSSSSAAGDGAIDLKGLALRLPNGTPLVNADDFSSRKGERTLMTGPSGSGKSTLFRAIAGIWPFGGGSIAVPAGATLDDAAAAAVLPDRIAARGGRLSRRRRAPSPTARSPSALEQVGLPKLAAQLDDTGTGTGRSRSASSSASGWRARCCMRRNTCSSTKRPPRSMNLRRRRCIACSRTKLPATTIVSIGHRSTLDAFHQRNVSAGARWRSVCAGGRRRGGQTP